MLPLAFHRRHLRRTTWVTLLAWVLALAAGVANACQLEPHDHRTHTSILATQDDATEPGVHAEHDGDEADAGKASCLKFCDDESSALAKDKTAPADAPCLVELARVDWALALPAASGSMQRLAELPTAQGPPLVIRFLRLTI